MRVLSKLIPSDTRVPRPGETEASRVWYYQSSRKLANINPREVLRDTAARENSRNYVTPGRLYMFLYSPKNANTLPYYDRFPLVFPYEVTEKGFTGINMHYLPPAYRAVLMDGLLDYLSPNEDENRTKIRLTYELLTSVSRLRFYKPAVRQYLNNFVRSRFLLVPSNEWNMALMLPLQRFSKANIQTVYKESRQIIRASQGIK